MGGAAVTSLWFTFVILGFTSAEPIKIEAKSGDTVNLICQTTSNIKVIEWSRPDLKPECVLLYRNKQTEPDSQNPAFKNRVELKMEGNVTLSLKKVTTNDTGYYECRVLINRRKRAIEPVSIIYLHVVPPDPHRHWGMVGFAGALMTVAMVIGALIYKQLKKEPPPPSPPSKVTEQQLVGNKALDNYCETVDKTEFGTSLSFGDGDENIGINSDKHLEI